MTGLLVVIAAALLVAWRRKRRHAVHMNRSRRWSSLFAVIGILALHLLVGGPAASADECGSAPNPERPGTGMVGALDPPNNQGEKDSPYFVYGYAGMVWHVYDDNCVLSKGITDPNSTIDTWAGNELFNLGKNLVGATNSLHYTLLGRGILGGLNEQIGDAANSVFNNVYMQLFGVFMAVLAVIMFRYIWRGDLATVSKRGMYAIAGMWMAASTVLLVANYTRVDSFIVNTTNALQAGFVDPNSNRFPQHVLPTDLHNKVVYENWLRGEFGKADAPQATEFGRKLLEAQAWSWDDVRTGADADQAKMDAKKAEYKKIATQLGPATGYFKGTDGSRTGSGFLAFFQAIVYSLFQLFAKLAVLLAQLLLRILTLTAPVIGLVAIVHPDILRRVGKAAGAVVLNVLVLAVLAGIHFKFLQLIFGPAAKMSLLTQMLLAGLVTFVFFLVGKPTRRMWQMVELSAGAAGMSMPSAPGGIFSRFRRRKDGQPSQQDDFWDTVRDSELEPVPAGGAPTGLRRPRPEASQPVTATAERMDARAGTGAGPLGIGPAGTRALPAARSGFEPDAVITGAPPGRGPGDMVITATASRIVDTVPVADRNWDRGEDAVVVPSRVDRGGWDNPATPVPAPPRQVDGEVIAGRPVNLVYRPSRGLEVSQPPRRVELRSGPRDTDHVVR